MNVNIIECSAPEPCILSDAIFALSNANPNLKAALILLHSNWVLLITWRGLIVPLSKYGFLISLFLVISSYFWTTNGCTFLSSGIFLLFFFFFFGGGEEKMIFFGFIQKQS